jgi:hypothetical protein
MAEPGEGNGKCAIFIAAALDDYGLTADEFRVLCRIARRGDCTEGTKGIAEGCKLSERQVRYAVRVLTACGFISIQERVGFTSIMKCQPQTKWVKPEQYDAVKAQVLTADPKRKPTHKTPARPARPAHGAGGVLHTVQGGTAHGAAKGNPIKVIPVKESKPNGLEREDAPGSKKPRKEDPYYAEFGKAFKGVYEIPYKSSVKDFVQLAGAKDTYGEKFTLAEWLTACGNYFASPQGSHTLADLCARYPVFRKSALDRFKQPVEPGKENQNGSNAKINSGSGAYAATGKPAPGGFRTPKPPDAIGAQAGLLAMSGQGLDSIGQGSEALSMSTAEDYEDSITERAEDVWQAEAIPIKAASRIASEADSRYQLH